MSKVAKLNWHNENIYKTKLQPMYGVTLNNP